MVGFALTRDTTTEVPNVTGNQLKHRDLAAPARTASTIGEVRRVEREAPANTVLEQDPAASPPGDEASLDCAFLTFFCSKPKVTLTVSAGPGSAKVPATAGLTRAEAEAKLEEAGFKARQVEDVHSDSVEAGLVIHSTPSGGDNGDAGHRRRPHHLQWAEAGQGAGAGRHPALGRGAADPRPRPISQRRRSDQLEAGGRGDPPVAQRGREASTAGSTVSIVVSKGEEKTTVPNVIGKLRAEAVEALRAAGLKPVVQEQETEAPSKVGRVTDQFPPPGSEVERAPK